MSQTIINLINALRSKIVFRTLYWFIRISLGLTFVISGSRKMPGQLFTNLPLDNPVGEFFHAMHEMGFYWTFIGLFQIVTGLMIFLNRFVVASSLLMMPVTINIFLISIALNMKGTPIITSAMLLANIYLLLWNYERYMPIIRSNNRIK